MAFLDNSGDIILDAVLTDLGRERLGRGDGSFSIAKFAAGDVCINYELYRNANHPNGAHPSGSSYYDLEILQTPILEAFTNNASSMQHKLMSLKTTNLLYLPVIKLNNGSGKTTTVGGVAGSTALQGWSSSSPTNLVGAHLVAVDEVTAEAFNAASITGVMDGYSPPDGQSFLQVEQGLDSLDLSPKIPMDVSLVETQYLIEMDNRLGWIANTLGTKQNLSFLDDDDIATYTADLATSDLVDSIQDDTEEYTKPGSSVLRSGRGTRLRFKIGASLDLQTPKSTYWFDLLGRNFSASTTNFPAAISDDRGSHANNLDTRTDSGELKYIDSVVRVIGQTTGYRLDIPVRFVKCTTCSDTNP